MDVRTINTIFMRAQGGTPDMWGGNATHFTSYTLTWSSDLSNNGCAHPLRTARTSNRAFQFWKKSKLWYWGSNKGGKKKTLTAFLNFWNPVMLYLPLFMTAWSGSWTQVTGDIWNMIHIPILQLLLRQWCFFFLPSRCCIHIPHIWYHPGILTSF